MDYSEQIRVETDAYKMRDLIANGIGENKGVAADANAKSENAVSTANNANNRVNNILATQVEGKDPEVIDAHYSNITGQTSTNIGERMDGIDADLAGNTQSINALQSQIAGAGDIPIGAQNQSIEDVATDQIKKYYFPVNYVSSISNDGDEDIQFNFDKDVGDVGTITLKPYEALVDFPIVADSLSVQAPAAKQTGKINYANKVSGSIVENLNSAYMIYQSTLSATNTNEFGNTSYSNVASDDEVELAYQASNASTAGVIGQHIFLINLLAEVQKAIPTVTISNLLSTISNVTIKWQGRGLGANGGVQTGGAKISAMNIGTSIYDEIGSTTQGNSSNEVDIVIPNLANYVSATGFMRINMHSTYPSDGTIATLIATDYFELDYDYAKPQPFRAWGLAGYLAHELFDFIGKITGSTVENLHTANLIYSASISNIGGNEFGQQSYDDIEKALDGKDIYFPNAVNGNYTQALFTMYVLQDIQKKRNDATITLSDITTALQEIDVRFIGRGKGSNAGVDTGGAVIEIWNFTTSAFVSLGEVSQGSVVEDKTFAITQNIADYISTDGRMKINAHSKYPSNGTINSIIGLDYFDITFKYKKSGGV